MNDIDQTIPLRRTHFSQGADDMTMPGKRVRQQQGSFQIGDLLLNRYQIISELGQGGMGRVYKCFDGIAGIEVAIKSLPPELSHNSLEMEDIKDNFQLTAKLVHQNIAVSKNLEKDHSNGNYYLVMECVDGEALHHWIRRKRRGDGVTPDDILPIIRQVANALDYAHSQKIIHRDIKPGNIIMQPDGTVKILDFGLAAQIRSSMSRISMVHYETGGTGPYMSPEQWMGRAQNARTDQYALGVMAYEMLAGHLPFESVDTAVLREAVLKSDAVPLENVPKYVNAAILRAMSKDPAERFDSCADFAAALSGKKIRSSGKSSCSAFLKWGLIVFLILSAAGLAGYWQYDRYRREQLRVQQEKNAVLQKLIDAQNKQQWSEVEIHAFELLKLSPGHTLAQKLQDRAKAELKRLKEAEDARKKAQKEREERAELERRKRRAELIQANYRLLPRIMLKKTTIDHANHDRGQTFGRHLDLLAEHLASAQLAENNNDPAAANTWLKAADKAADWIINNAPLRQKTLILLREIPSGRQQADKFNASTLAAETYRAAALQHSEAGRYYESGNFKQALEALEKARKGYQTACNTARKETISNLLAAARKAGDNGDWQMMSTYAASVLKIDRNNLKAQAMQIEAEENAIPSFKLNVSVNGKPVAVNCIAEKTAPVTSTWPRQLEDGKEYAFTLTYKAPDGSKYTGKLSFTCDWKGCRTFTPSLKKLTFPQTVFLTDDIRIDMVKIRAGTFFMGSPAEEYGRWASDEKMHKVTLSKDYWIGKFEVTQAQYEAVMGKNPSAVKGADLPVHKLSWYDAKAFCYALNRKFAGKLPSGYQFDLPTEAQWEYACRAGSASALNSGKNLTGTDSDSSILAEVAWSGLSNPEKKPHPGGKKSPNKWGLYDMHGNVWEWCRDWYGYYTEIMTDPTGPDSGLIRVIRGGGWLSSARRCRSANRSGLDPGKHPNDLGFRLALVPVK